MKHEYTDKNIRPVPQLKVGDICYASWPWGENYSHVSTCKIRKIEVKWVELEAWREAGGTILIFKSDTNKCMQL